MSGFLYFFLVVCSESVSMWEDFVSLLFFSSSSIKKLLLCLIIVNCLFEKLDSVSLVLSPNHN